MAGAGLIVLTQDRRILAACGGHPRFSGEIIATISISPWLRPSRTPAITYDTFPGKMPDYRIGTLMRTPTMPAPAAIAEKFHTLTATPRAPSTPARRRVGWYLRLHLICLILYAIFGKGFAYLGTRFFYVSEVLLVLGLIALIVHGGYCCSAVPRSVCVMLPFLMWQMRLRHPIHRRLRHKCGSRCHGLGLFGLRLDHGGAYSTSPDLIALPSGTLSAFCALVLDIWSIGCFGHHVFRRNNSQHGPAPMSRLFC